MKALYFEREGEPLDVLQLKETAVPEPGENEVRIKWLGSSINPADVLFIQGKYRFKPQFPQIAGLEGAGIVDATGSNVQLSPGTLVAFLYRNAWAEYVIVPEKELFVLPEKFPVEKAMQFVLNPATAWGLLHRASLQAGDWLLLSAGNSSVSSIITQIARTREIQVISIVRSGEYESKLKELGAVAVINTSNESIVQRVQQITGGKGATVAIDAVGGDTGTQMAQALGVNGKQIAYGVLSPEPVQIPNGLLVYKNISMSGFGIRGLLESLSAKEKQEMTAALIDLLVSSDFKMDISESYTINQFKTAFQSYASGSANGKIILKP
jgi:NADPH:quinone reductase-like Zn-dependent oxidoreductase